VIFAKLEEQTVVGNLTSAESISLRDVAADMWQAVVEQGSEEAAARTLAEEYEVEETTVRADLEDLVAELLVQGFLAREAALER
jgi:hypothetical protein